MEKPVPTASPLHLSVPSMCCRTYLLVQERFKTMLVESLIRAFKKRDPVHCFATQDIEPLADFILYRFSVPKGSL